jgi:four helix bundle protein
MDRRELENRTKTFNVRVIKFCNILPKTAAGYELAKQLIRAAGSVGANYRATKRAKSDADFVNKLGIVLEEADESHYWLEVIRDAEITSFSQELEDLIKEAYELTAIFTAADSTAKQNKRSK